MHVSCKKVLVCSTIY